MSGVGDIITIAILSPVVVRGSCPFSVRGFCPELMSWIGDVEIARLDIAGLDNGGLILATITKKHAQRLLTCPCSNED